MRKATQGMRRFAEHLVAHEIAANGSRLAPKATAFTVCEKLRPHLARLMGAVGVRALMVRALALADQEVPWLHALTIEADGSFTGLDAQSDALEHLRGGVLLLAQLLGLLVTFIGVDLTLRLVRDIWPKLSVDNLDLGKEIKT